VYKRPKVSRSEMSLLEKSRQLGTVKPMGQLQTSVVGVVFPRFISSLCSL
jgi:hypothetical protein